MNNLATRDDSKLITVSAVDLFHNDGLDAVLDQIAAEARAHVPDLDTNAGRKAIASVAHSVARSKTYLDKKGMELVAEQRAIVDRVNADRKRARDYLDALKAEIRAPLEEWEQAEQARLDGHQRRLDELRSMSQIEGMTADQIGTRLEVIEAMDLGADFWDEFAEEARTVHESILSTLGHALTAQRQAEADAAELAQLRKDKAERDAREAQERAEREAQAKAEQEAAEAKAREQAQKEAIARAEEVERQREARARQDAERLAEEARLQAIEAERQRVEAEKRAEEEARQKREADLANRRAVSDAIHQALVTRCKLTGVEAGLVVDALVSGDVPHVTVEY